MWKAVKLQTFVTAKPDGSWIISLTLRPPYLRGRNFQRLLCGRLDGPQSLCGHFGREKFFVLGIEPRSRTLSQVTKKESQKD